jgi:hypothetical protein
MSEVQMLKWVGKKGEILERIYWIEKVFAVEKQVCVFFILMVREKFGGGRDVEVVVPCCKPGPLAVVAGGPLRGRHHEETTSKCAAGARIKQVPSRRQQ